MTARFGIAAAALLLLPPALASAQGAPHPPIRPAPDRAAWLERYQEARHGSPSTGAFSKTFTVGPSGSLDIVNMSGDIVVTGVAGDRISVNAVKEAWGKGTLDDVVVDASQTAGRVEVRGAVRGRRDAKTEVTFSIEVPYGTAVTARTLAGDIKVVNVKGEVQIDSTSGTVEALGTPRLIRLKTVSGDVRMEDAAAADTLSASTISGDLVARALTARTLEIVTVSGDVTLKNAVCERASLRSVNGDVEYVGPVARGGRYEFNSHSGDVHFALMGGGGFELSARTFNGEIRAEMPLVMAPRADDPDLPGMPGNREVRGRFGDGSALIVVKTFSGDVVIGRAEIGSRKEKLDKKPE